MARTAFLLCAARACGAAVAVVPPALKGASKSGGASAGFLAPSEPLPCADPAGVASTASAAEPPSSGALEAAAPAGALLVAGPAELAPEPSLEDFEYLNVPEDRNASRDGELTSKDCALPPLRPDCALYYECPTAYCVINGYMIVPGAPMPGMEAINGVTAGNWDWLWSAARRQCGSDHCVLIINPAGHRTQNQMHIHFRHYNGGGASLKRRLERALCGHAGWQPFSECGSAKARIFPGMPGVFTAVAQAYGGRSLAHVGITVWFTHRCGGGQKTMVLATTHCTIEHTISAR